MEHRRHVDAWVWEIFVEACGGFCCECKRKDLLLVRGHILPHSMGGRDGWDNLLPLCDPCNKKYGKKRSPDNRAFGWNARFFLLLGQRLQPEISCAVIENALRLIPTAQAIENAQVVKWDSSDLDAGNKVSQSSHTLTDKQAAALACRLVLHADKQGCPPPTRNQQTELIKLAVNNGPGIFWNAGLTFLEGQEWMGRSGEPTPSRWHVWDPFYESFFVYEGRFREAQRRAIAARKEEAKRKRREWEQSLRDKLTGVLDIPGDWTGLSDADRAHIAAIRGKDFSADPLTFVWSDLQKSRALSKRYRDFKQKKGDDERAHKMVADKLAAIRDPFLDRLRALEKKAWYSHGINEWSRVFYDIWDATSVDEIETLADGIPALEAAARNFDRRNTPAAHWEET